MTTKTITKSELKQMIREAVLKEQQDDSIKSLLPNLDWYQDSTGFYKAAFVLIPNALELKVIVEPKSTNFLQCQYINVVKVIPTLGMLTAPISML